MSERDGFEGWAILELMGHRRLTGHVSEVEIAAKRQALDERAPDSQTWSGPARRAPELDQMLLHRARAAAAAQDFARQAQAAIALQRDILEQGDTIEPKWAELGWRQIDRALEQQAEQLRLLEGAAW